MRKKNLEKAVIVLILIFILAAVWFMFGDKLPSGNSEIRKGDTTVMPDATGVSDEIKKGNVVEQSFICSADTISKVGIVFSRSYYLEGISLTLELLEGNKTVAKNTYDVSEIEEQHRTYVIPSQPLLKASNKEFSIRIYSADNSDTGMKVMISSDSDSSYKFGKKTVKGTLCFSVTE